MDLRQPERILIISFGGSVSDSAWLGCAGVERRTKGNSQLTRQSQQFIANENGRVVLVFVHGVLPPFPQKFLHGVSSIRECSAVLREGIRKRC